MPPRRVQPESLFAVIPITVFGPEIQDVERGEVF
jgi:hypothetical protein